VTTGAGAAAAIPGPLLVDAHAHLHREFDLQKFLAAAADNAAQAADQGVAGHRPIGVLLFAESEGEGAFARLRSADDSMLGVWTIHPTPERESLLIRASGRLRLIVVAGRQIVTSEGVEVLGLLTAQPIADGATMAETVAALRRQGAVVVLPWGFGKWTLRRGALVASFLRTHPREIFLGDNSGRLGLARAPRLFDEARRLGVPILPGSDPLPFRDQLTRIGSFGFVCDTTLSEEQPAEGLRSWLHGLGVQPIAYGELETLGRFCWNQGRMQWRKRVARPR
jgi:hypothetical protein